MASAAITKRTVDAAKPGKRDYFIWDGGGQDVVKGFGLKVTPSGGKVYVYQYRIARPGEAERTPAKRVTIGSHGGLTPEQARIEAKKLAHLVGQGVDPRQRKLDDIAAKDETKRLADEMARIEGQLAFDKVAALWLDHYENEKGRRPSSVRLATLVVNRYLTPALGDLPLPRIGRKDIQPVIDAIPLRQKGTRRAVFAYSSVLFGWATKRGDIAGNPMIGMGKPEAPKGRERVLTDDELAKVWNASVTLGDPFGPFFRLLVLTGQRRGEVAAMSWSELDRATATWTIPADRAKNAVVHIVPICALAFDELDRLAAVALRKETVEEPQTWPRTGFVFTTTGKTPISGITKAKSALDAAIAKGDRTEAAQSDERCAEPVPAWRIHDLRRTFATGFQRLGIRFEVTEATLNHVSGARGGIAGIYQRHDWKEEKRSALTAWSDHVGSLTKPKDGDNVVPFGAVRKIA